MKRKFRALAASALVLTAVLPCRAEWQEFGRLQVASQTVLMSQLQLLASQIKFPLLPMMVGESFSQSDFAQKIGVIDESADWGGRFYINQGKTLRAWYWPVSGGKSAWEKANPDAKPKEFLFTKDGRYACMSDMDVLVKKSAKAGFPFEKPLKKGFVRLVLDNGEFFSNLEKLTGEAIKEMEKSGDVKVEIPEWNSKLVSCVGNVKRLTALLGLSKSGLDIRVRVTPKDGAEVGSIIEIVKSSGEIVDASCKEAKAVFPELGKIKNATVLKISDNASQAAALGVPSGELWLLTWRDGRDLRMIVRVQLQELAKAFQSMMQLQVEEMSK